jgi:hypothetical protein
MNARPRKGGETRETRLDELIMKSMAEGLSDDEFGELLKAKESGLNLKRKVLEAGGSLKDYNRIMKRLSRMKPPPSPKEEAGKKVLEEESKYLGEKVERDFQTIRKIEDVLAKYSEDLKAEGRPFDEVIDSALDFYFTNKDQMEELRMRVQQLQALSATLAEALSPSFREVVEARLYSDLVTQLAALKARGYDITPEAVAEAVKAVRGGIGRVYAENQLLKALLRARGEGQRSSESRNDTSGHGKLVSGWKKRVEAGG